ncbi:hypothetical protein H0A70_08140 [Alcaligenaceae bacterium]|nr:hypothetical protein [Alcaligenaceae bacterium]
MLSALTLIRSYWKPLAAIVLAVAVAAGLIAIRQSGKAAGRQEAEQQQTAEALDALRKSKDNYENVARMDDDAQLAEFDRLRDLRRKTERR